MKYKIQHNKMLLHVEEYIGLNLILLIQTFLIVSTPILSHSVLSPSLYLCQPAVCSSAVSEGHGVDTSVRPWLIGNLNNATSNSDMNISGTVKVEGRRANTKEEKKSGRRPEDGPETWDFPARECGGQIWLGFF